MNAAGAVLFYVSGHGHGHSVRAAAVIRALRMVRPDLPIYVRTTAPPSLFAECSGTTVLNADIDPGVVENGPFRIDWPASAEKLARFLASCAAITSRETEWVRRRRVRLIVADIPFLAGEIAAASGVACVGIGNFLWDWIYEPILAADGHSRDLLRMVGSAYSRFRSILRPPFCHRMTCAPIIDVPLIADRGVPAYANDITRAGLPAADGRPRVLVTLRGGVPNGALARIAAHLPDFVFLHTGVTVPEDPANVVGVRDLKGWSFADIVSVADVIVGKPGYGTMSACVANRKRLLVVPRIGFREDELLLAEAARSIPMRILPLEELHSGGWGSRLQAILGERMPDIAIDSNGARICADLIGRAVDGP